MGLVLGCSSQLPPQGALYQRLSNRGPVLLSADNPYLPANRLLSEELGNSAELREFVAQRGSPAAIQVTQGMLARTELSLIYPAENEIYHLAKKQTGWAIGAPESLSESALEQIENELALGGMTLGDTREANRYVAAVLPPPYDYESDRDRASLAQDDGPPKSSVPEKLSRRLNYGGGAKLAKTKIVRGGALHHTVTFPGESLSVVASWYTASVSNISAIAKANKISRDGGLRLGQVVIIPAKLLKNKRPLSLSYLKNALR